MNKAKDRYEIIDVNRVYTVLFFLAPLYQTLHIWKVQ